VNDNSETSAGTMTATSALFIGVGAMVGAGIFALLGQAGAIAGSATWLSFLVAGVISLFLGFSFIKLSLRYLSRGGLIELLAVEFGSGPLVAAVLLEVYLSKVKERRVPASSTTTPDPQT
jgi:amino acid transporter